MGLDKKPMRYIREYNKAPSRSNGSMTTHRVDTTNFSDSLDLPQPDAVRAALGRCTA